MDNSIISRITLNQEVCKGKPTIRNMRFTVTQMLELVESGMSFEEILEDYSFLEREDIMACMLYASRISDAKTLIPLAA